MQWLEDFTSVRAREYPTCQTAGGPAITLTTRFPLHDFWSGGCEQKRLSDAGRPGEHMGLCSLVSLVSMDVTSELTRR